jgi:hypothetical protein
MDWSKSTGIEGDEDQNPDWDNLIMREGLKSSGAVCYILPKLFNLQTQQIAI